MSFDFTKEPGRVKYNRNLVVDSKPLVSIITPYYNAGKYIQQTCNCVLNQTFPYFEWIIVDDGSTNKEDVEILDKIVAQDKRIKVFHKNNGGAASARNFGIRKATSEYLLPLDGDDLIEPTFIEYCWWALEKNPEAAWAYSDSLGFQGVEYLWEKTFDPIELKTVNQLSVTALIRKTAYEKTRGYNEDHKYSYEDWHFWLQLVAQGQYPVQIKGEHLFWYRRSDTGVLSIVESNDEISSKNKELVDQAAQNVISPKSPVVFSGSFVYDWESPKMSEWDECIYKDKTKRHIAFLIPWLEMGGADKFNLDLLKGLDKKQYDVGVITTLKAGNAWLQEFREATPEIFNLPNFMEAKDYAEFISYYIKSRNVDVLFLSNSYHGYYLTPWLREQFPDLVIVDYLHMEEWYWRKGGYARTSGKIGAITEKTYVCNSSTEDVMIEVFDRDSDTVETVHIGIDEKHFDRNNLRSGILYEELNISDKRPVVLFICRLHPQKRPFLMLEIAKKVKEKIYNVAFAVVGNGPQEEELKSKVKAMNLENTVYFLGAKKEVRPYYVDAKATLVCSIKEGLSLTAYESCSMGVPIVSADVGGQKDLVDDTVGALIPFMQDEADEFDARNFPDEEISLYADAIIELLSNEKIWKEKSVNCRKRIEESFTINSMVEFFNEEFMNLITSVEMRAKRNQISQALKMCSPMAADYYTMEMQQQSTETNNIVYIPSESSNNRLDDLYIDGYYVKFYRFINRLFPLGGRKRKIVKAIARVFLK